MTIHIPDSWKTHLQTEFKKPYFKALKSCAKMEFEIKKRHRIRKGNKIDFMSLVI